MTVLIETMAHLRKRFATAHLEEALAFSPLVGVLGQRQVGKTTLVESLVTGHYVSFDDETTKTAAELAPRQFLEQFDSLSDIDECQKVPRIFPALKLCVQKNKRPGQFLLTGSVRFTSRKAIQESLTGRVYNVEILPLSVAEMNQKPLADFVKWTKLSATALNDHVARRSSWFNDHKKNLYLSHGGLPGIFFCERSLIATRSLRLKFRLFCSVIFVLFLIRPHHTKTCFYFCVS